MTYDEAIEAIDAATAKAVYSAEKDVKKYVRRILSAWGCLAWMPAANGYGVSGVADILVLHQGRFAAIETKFGTRKPTPNQVKFLHDVHVHGGIAVLINDRNLRERMTKLASVLFRGARPYRTDSL